MDCELFNRILKSSMIIIITTWFAYKLSISQYQRLMYGLIEKDRSVLIISKKGLLNVNYTIWKDKKIMYLSSDIIIDDIFKMAFINSSIKKPIIISQKDITDGGIDNINEWKIYMVKQHPINRFLDLYMRYCQKLNKINEMKCLRCFSDLDCIVTELYKEIDKKSKGIIGKINYEEIFYPYIWKFPFIEQNNIIFNIENNNDFKVKIGKELIFFNASNIIIKKSFDIINKFTQLYSTRKNINKKRKLIEKSLEYNKLLLNKFISMYYCDFKYFGFDVLIF
ncbi:Hypothetical protein SRAE_2000094600 [Strongyloides ratti]|uniref:Uncharacterized protein n=1 Tax=Strongyloides ratti TaxID=34506 RepID=A0A090L929_STRRB|nr:Hypothetical protein SRAE_2000094600 [Strongyloides ratti]CEF66276.1 Hypothetical protein SRAE_2000094600 [Strongyloides ratti]